MVKRKKALKGAKGSALFMVICVMAILMVVAITAMAMVSLAYTRSLQNYTASQSYVTAVNALDMITDTTHYTGSGSNTGNYGQDEAAVELIAQPLREVLWDCMGATVKGGQVKYGTIEITAGPLGSDAIQFLPLDGDPDKNGGNNILYEVLPAPADPADGKASVDPADPGAPECGYGEYKEYNGRYYTHARVKISVKVQSGSGDTAQIRTVSKVIDPMISWKETSTPKQTTPPGIFDQAVKALGKYTSSPGVKVIGGMSTKSNNSVDFSGLNEITKSIFINSDMSTTDSGHSGDIKIGGSKQIAVNGTLTVGNNFNIASTFIPGTTSGSKPFIYCENIQWGNSNLPSGHIDILTKTGGIYGRDDNEITGNVISGGNLSLRGNNLKISGKIFVDGDVNIESSLSNGGGTIYYTGSITGQTDKQGNVTFKHITAEELASYNFDIKNPKTDPESGQLIINSPDSTREYHVMTEESVFSDCYDSSGDLVSSDSDKYVTPGAEGAFSVVVDEKGNVIPEENIVRITSASTGKIEVPVGKTIVFETLPDIVDPATGEVKKQTTNYKDLEIVVAKGAGVVDILQTPGNIDLKGVRIWSQTVKEAVESGKELNMDEIAKDPEYSKIFWDVPKGSNVSLDSQDPGNLVNAYIYGPEANFTAETQGAGVQINYEGMKDGGKQNKVWLLGSVIGNDIKMGNELGIIFIDPYAGAEDPGSETPPSGTPSSKTDIEQNVNNGNIYYTNR